METEKKPCYCPEPEVIEKVCKRCNGFNNEEPKKAKKKKKGE